MAIAPNTTSQLIDQNPTIVSDPPIDEHEENKQEEQDEDEEDEQPDTAWDDWQNEGDEPQPELLCLFCESRFQSTESLFLHCRSDHSFDFSNVRNELGLDFYGCVKLINFIRANIAANKSWSYGFVKCESFAWEDDRYLKPFLEDDALLHCFDEFGECEIEDEGCAVPIDREKMMKELGKGGDFAGLVDNGNSIGFGSSSRSELSSLIEGNGESRGDAADVVQGERGGRKEEKRLKVSFANVAAKELKKANESYFGSYGSFGIHREMLSDKARMDAYSGALLNNPSLMKGAAVMDVGCGTGILSLFAAKAGASSVIAVEASEKMASVAKQVIKDNGLLYEDDENGECRQHGIIKVACGMVEELDRLMNIPPHSIDVLVSEWMGYCLLFETMLDSVLYARDRWLKPGGAILPDTATIFAAGFGKGGTSLPFWENVYGFDMSSIGKEVREAAAESPIIDVVDEREIITGPAILQKFDLATVKADEVDFTATVELELRSGITSSKGNGFTLCYGIVLWFETGFTNRFCRETPTVLSTSPYSGKTHWSQAIFTFSEPIAMLETSLPTCLSDECMIIGSKACPATKISARISIARASFHRSIDISLELTGVSADGRKHSFPAQIFDL